MGAGRSSTEPTFLRLPDGTRLATLPPAKPTLVLVGSSDTDVTRAIDRLAASTATTLDLRSNVLWSEVPDGLAFLASTLDQVTTERDAVRFAFASPDATVEELLQRALLAADLEQLANAFERARLAANPPTYEVRYQPVVSLANRDVVGFESLIRARAAGELVNAEELIARATRGGWLNELDQLGRTMALRGVGSWLDAGLLFLNVMAPDGRFDMDAIMTTIKSATDKGLDPDQIVLEAMERNRYTDLAAAADQIQDLRELGVRIAVDDVGDGFASLRVVAAFKPDIVKIAGHLVKDLPSEESEAAIKAIVQLAHDTGSWVVAENIETNQQATRLKQLGVDWGQGLLLGAPNAEQPTDNPDLGPRPLLSRS